jgi:lipopolysaccharide/colanic/teichoic acid biosynthesis glycosyltransferase
MRLASGQKVTEMKRLFDVVTAALALPLLALAWLIRRKLGSPVLFCQVRPGLQGRPFTMVKFRTMTDERGPDGALLPDAQRLTPFDRFLRASTLDELPELWNVLKGKIGVRSRLISPSRSALCKTSMMFWCLRRLSRRRWTGRVRWCGG